MAACDPKQPVENNLMIRATIIFAFLSCTACEPRGLYEIGDGEAYLAAIVEVGSTIHEVESALAENDVDHYEVSAELCEALGGFLINPEDVCAGGPALRLTLSENSRPMNPFYSPTMHAFLPFDENAELVSVRVFVVGGD
jgi:hypothetical protein